jgi:hypothetical protein
MLKGFSREMANNDLWFIFPYGGYGVNLDTLYLIDQKDGLGLEFSKLVSMMNDINPIKNPEVKLFLRL